MAALVVVVFHAAQFARDFVGPLPPAVEMLTGRGYLGVDFFFVLSGFIIYHTNLGKEPGRRWAARYLESRLVRIFVPYLPVGIAVALGYVLLPSLSAGSREWSWLASLTLLPAPAPPALIVAWTLQYELIFYLMFGLFFLVGRPLLGCALWAGAAVAWHFAMGELPTPYALVLGILIAEFFFGMLVARLVSAPVPSLVFAGGALALLLLYVALGGQAGHRVVFAGAIAMALIPIIRAEQSGMVAVPAFAVLLGNASYAIYLVHNPLMALLSRFPPPGVALTLIWLFVAGTAAGLAYHLIFEKPAIGAVRGWFARRRHARAEPVPAAAGGADEGGKAG